MTLGQASFPLSVKWEGGRVLLEVPSTLSQCRHNQTNNLRGCVCVRRTEEDSRNLVTVKAGGENMTSGLAWCYCPSREVLPVQGVSLLARPVPPKAW